MTVWLDIATAALALAFVVYWLSQRSERSEKSKVGAARISG